LVSMAHAATMAIGAYTSVILMQRYHASFVVAFVSASIVAGVISALVGLLGTRVKPNYFLVITTGIHYTVILVLINEAWLTGGGIGLFDVPSAGLGPLVLDTDQKYYLLLVPLVVLALYCADRLRSSRAGRAMVALRQNEVAASISSVNVPLYRVAAMAFAGVYLGAAGSLFAHLVGFLGTDSFGLSLTLQLTLVVVVGGIGSNFGAIASVAALTVATEQFKDVGDTWILWYGVLIMVLMVVAPRGIAGVIGNLLAFVVRDGRNGANRVVSAVRPNVK